MELIRTLDAVILMDLFDGVLVGGGSLIPVGSGLTMERDHFDPFINGIKIRSFHLPLTWRYNGFLLFFFIWPNYLYGIK